MTMMNEPLEMLILENNEQTLQLCTSDEMLVFSESEKGKLPKVSQIAYTGGPMMSPLFELPVIVNIAGLDISNQAIPLLRDHDKGREVGHTTNIEKTSSGVFIEGLISGDTEDTRRIVSFGKNGFPYQSSIGTPFRRSDVSFVRAGASVKVNGRQFRGPLYVIEKSTLKEVSVVSLGADANTKTKIAAALQEGKDMDFETWLRAQDFDPETITDKQRKTLEASWKAENAPPPQSGVPKVQVTADDVNGSVLDFRTRHAEESTRISEIQAICGDNHTIQAQAIGEGWTTDKTELEVLKASRTPVNGIARAGDDKPKNLSELTLEAAIMNTLGVAEDTRMKFYGEKTLEAADTYGGLGLQELAMLTCQMSGQDHGPIWGDGERWIRGAFSTNSLSNILENVMHKQALMAYNSAEIQALKIAKISRTTDFKQVSRLRLFGTGQFERVGAGGEIPSGKLTDQKFTNQADTFAQVIFIDRQTMINDDLQMLKDTGNLMGHSGREVLNDVVFTKLLANAGSFFSVGNNNVVTGGGSAFGQAGLKAALLAFRKQKAGPGTKAKDQKPININPEILLVPPELEIDAQILMGSANIDAGGGSANGNMNPHKGRYQTVSAPHLSDESYTGFSATAWFLLANPNILPAIELLALNGKVEPTIERVAPPPNQLGVGFRGYIDVGAELQDPKGIVRSAGS